jgi:hypothetical protein
VRGRGTESGHVTVHGHFDRPATMRYSLLNVEKEYAKRQPRLILIQYNVRDLPLYVPRTRLVVLQPAPSSTLAATHTPRTSLFMSAIRLRLRA